MVAPNLMLAVSVFYASCVQAPAAQIPPPHQEEADMLVGAFYFPGWSRVDRWYCIAANDQALHPLLGYYREGDPDAADWHIKWALEHGVSFFAFDYYTSAGSQMLETALDDGFLKSRFIDRFKFCLNWCNHAPAETQTAEELYRFGDLVIGKYLTHPSYLRIENKPVVMILCGNNFVRNLGVDAAKTEFRRLEDRCKAAGLDGVYLVFCEGGIGTEEDMRNAKAAGARVLCRYNFPYAGTGINGPGTHAELPYTHLVEQSEVLAKSWHELADGDFWPTVMPGWDRRPWTKHEDVMYTGGTPELFRKTLKSARSYVNKDRVVLVEAWNEWGEGSVLEPSVEHGFAYLDQVRGVFCPNAGPHEDAGPKSLGLRQPVFEVKLPSEDMWRFDYDLNGWSGTGLSDLRAHWGALHAKSTSRDPQLTSSITYLDCDNYARARLRMQAEGAQGRATGQLFWSTVEHALSEDASVEFEVLLDGKWHDYDLDLAANSNWKGRTDRLRLDPVDVAGVDLRIDEIRLEEKP